MNAALPPRARLAHVVRSLATALPGQVGSLLDAPRFAEGKAALLRLASPSGPTDAALSMSPDEAARLADILIERWSLLADPVLEPAAAVLVPEEIWLGDRAARIEVALATYGLEDGWEAVWEGSVIDGPPAQSAVLVAQPPEGKARAEAVVRARLRARAKGGARLLLLAEATVRLRRPQATVSEDARRLLVRDQADEPAVGVEVEVGSQHYVTGPGGIVELPKPPEEDALVRVQGIPAGKVRGSAKSGR